MQKKEHKPQMVILASQKMTVKGLKRGITTHPMMHLKTDEDIQSEISGESIVFSKSPEPVKSNAVLGRPSRNSNAFKMQLNQI